MATTKKTTKSHLTVVSLTIIVFALLPIVNILIDDDENFCENYVNEYGEPWDHTTGDYPEYHLDINEECVAAYDLAQLVIYDGLFGIVPRQNYQGRMHIPMINNLVVVGASASMFVIDPVLGFVSSYVPWWNYKLDIIYTTQYYLNENYFTYHEDGWPALIGVHGIFTEYYITDFYTVTKGRVIYIEELDAYYTVWRWFSSFYSVSAQLTENDLLTKYELEPPEEVVE